MLHESDMFVYENNNSLSTEICIDIINYFETKSNDKYKGVCGGGVNTDIKDTIDCQITENNESTYKYHRLLSKELTYNIRNYINLLNDSYLKDNTNTNNQYIFFQGQKLYFNTFQIQRYSKNIGKFTVHNDFSIEKDNGTAGCRMFVYIWYLNDVIEGGETILQNCIQIKPKIGKILIFPATWTYPHCGEVPKTDNKYIITGWVKVPVSSLRD